MTSKIMNLNNPNDLIFNIPQEEGVDEDDTYFSSIGDAVQNHIQGLSDFDRQCWEDLYVSPNKAIFRSEPSTNIHDRDPLSFYGKDLSQHKINTKTNFIKAAIEENNLARVINPSIDIIDKKDLELKALEYLSNIEEAYQEEEEYREKSQDALDQERVPYDEWIKYPQLWSSIEIPTTPKDNFFFLGSCKQQFYDNFPEGHPDEKNINQCILMLNRDWDIGLTKKYVKFICDKMREWFWYSHFALNKCISAAQLIEKDEYNADDIMIDILVEIDDNWKNQYIEVVRNKTINDPIIQLILHKEIEWEEMFYAGQSIDRHIAAFGKLLFVNFKNKLNSYHWARYRRAKIKFAPKVIFKDQDINRCTLQVLSNIFNITIKNAKNIFFARPFKTIEELYNQGFIDKDSFYNDKISERIISFIDKRGNEAIKKQSKAKISNISQYLIIWQKEKKLEVSSDQWHMIWRYYKLLRNKLDRKVNVG